VIRVVGQLIGTAVNILLQLIYDIDSSLSCLLQFLTYAYMHQAKGLFIVPGHSCRLHRACVGYHTIEEGRGRFNFGGALRDLPERRRTHRLVIASSFFELSVDHLLSIGVCLRDEIVQKHTVSIRVTSRLGEAP